MKKIFTVILALAFIMAGVSISYAATGPTNPNAVWAGGSGQIVKGGPNGPCEYIRVRYGHCGENGPTLASGAIVAWDTTSHDGITVSACVAANTPIAGVLVTDLLTDDNGSFSAADRSFGYMAVSGYCLALMDTSNSTVNKRLTPTSDGLVFGYGATTDIVNTAISSDRGVLLQDTGSDGLMPVWLR